MVGILSTAIETVTALLDETCIIEDRTAAYCNYTFSGDLGGGTKTSTAYTTVITGSLFWEYPVRVTAGAEKLPAKTAAAAAGGDEVAEGEGEGEGRWSPDEL